MLEVITGPMFSGKTEEMLRRIRRAEIAGKRVQVFRPAIDDRYSEIELISHSGARRYAIPVSSPNDLISGTHKVDVVGVDEGQFFDRWFVPTAMHLSYFKDVIVTGLDTNFRGEPFTIMPELMARSDHLLKLSAVCHKCGEQATRTQRLIDDLPAPYDSPEVLVGGLESYEARCRFCHEV